MTRDIGTLREGPLHAGLKEWYRQPGDLVEHAVEGLVIDLVRNDLLIEIQTGGFTPLREKLERLLPRHRVRIVHPVAVDAWILRVGDGGEVISRRKSPKHEHIVDIFGGLVSIVDHLTHPHLEIDVVSTQQEQVRRHEQGKAWRRKGWVVDHRSLVDVLEVTEIRSVTALSALLPTTFDSPFSTADLTDALGCSRRTAQQMIYCLRQVGAVERCGQRGRTPLYELTLA